VGAGALCCVGGIEMEDGVRTRCGRGQISTGGFPMLTCRHTVSTACRALRALRVFAVVLEEMETMERDSGLDLFIVGG
jgi:hypothetical protein